MTVRKLVILGPGPDSLSKEEIEFLGNLMAKMLYHEIDTAANMLHKLRDVDLENLEKAAYNLSVICPVIRGD